MRSNLLKLFTSAMIASSTATTALADLIVVSSSSAPGVTASDTLKDDHIFDLGDKSEVSVIRSKDNVPFTLHGPFKGTIDTFVSHCTGMFRFVYSYCRTETGGDQLPLGGTRGSQSE
jgi:hypothetical protein